MNPVTRAWRWQQDQMAQGGQYASTIAMKGLGAMLLIDVVIPVATYYLFRAFDRSQTVALLVATIASACATSRSSSSSVRWTDSRPSCS